MSGIAVTISIVSYNSAAVLKQCIESVIRSAEGLSSEIIVVDNCSQDGSAVLVKEHFPEVRLIENPGNVGFGTAHNQSFRLSQGRYFLILNPDTVLSPDTLGTMVRFMDGNHRAGAAGCKIFWDDERHFMFPDLRLHSLGTALLHFTSFCRIFPGSRIARAYWRSAHPVWNAKTPLKIEGVTGGFIMVRREAFQSAGAFDEGFFLFFEEHDLFRRIAKKGWDIYYVPDAEIQHYFEESFRKSSIDVGAVYMKSAFYYYRKHYGLPGHLFIKGLLLLDRFLLFLEPVLTRRKEPYREIRPRGGFLNITWPLCEGALRYLVEVSYWPAFSDRAGMYVEGDELRLREDLLERLPGCTGFLRISPVYDRDVVGAAIEIVRISRQPDSGP